MSIKPADYPFWLRVMIVTTLLLFAVNVFFFLGPLVWFVTVEGNRAIEALAAIVVALFTVVLACVARRQADIVDAQQRLQRAYVFGGCGPTGLLRDDQGIPVVGQNGFPVLCFRPGCRNFGQTPAWVKQMVLVYCAEPLPSKPNYEAGRVREISDSVGPGGGLVDAPGGPELVEMVTATQMLYGRIYYLDMLENERYSSFVYRLRNDGHHERVVDDKYAEFRKWK
jgi:hypothetical protein